MAGTDESTELWTANEGRHQRVEKNLATPITAPPPSTTTPKPTAPSLTLAPSLTTGPPTTAPSLITAPPTSTAPPIRTYLFTSPPSPTAPPPSTTTRVRSRRKYPGQECPLVFPGWTLNLKM